MRTDFLVDITKLQLDPEHAKATAPASPEDNVFSDEEDEQPRRPLKACKGSRAAPIDVKEDDDEFSSGELPVKGPSASQSLPLRAPTAPLVDLTDDTPIVPATDTPLDKSSTNNLSDEYPTRASASPAEKEPSFDLAKKNAEEKRLPTAAGSSAISDDSEPPFGDTTLKAATSNATVAPSATENETCKDAPPSINTAATDEQAPSTGVENNFPTGGTENITPATIATVTTDTAVKKRVLTRKRKAADTPDTEQGPVAGATATGVATRSK